MAEQEWVPAIHWNRVEINWDEDYGPRGTSIEIPAQLGRLAASLLGDELVPLLDEVDSGNGTIEVRLDPGEILQRDETGQLVHDFGVIGLYGDSLMHRYRPGELKIAVANALNRATQKAAELERSEYALGQEYLDALAED
jgi:hypothetical protein